MNGNGSEAHTGAVPRTAGRPPEATSEAYRRQVRDTILDAAQKLYHSGGTDAVSVREVVRVSGVSTGSLYHHFRNRDQILDALVDRIADDVARVFDDAATGSRRSVDRLLAVALQRGIEAVLQRRATVTLVFGPERDPRLRSRVYDRFVQRTSRFFAEHPTLFGRRVRHVEVAAHAWQGSLFGVLDWIVAQPALTEREIGDAVRFAVRWNLAALTTQSRSTARGFPR